MALTDKELLAMSADDILALLMEECAETIVAASKATRFGPMRSWPGYNAERCNADGVIREALQVNQTLRAYCAKVGVNYGDALERCSDGAPVNRRYSDLVKT